MFKVFGAKQIVVPLKVFYVYDLACAIFRGAIIIRHLLLSYCVSVLAAVTVIERHMSCSSLL